MIPSAKLRSRAGGILALIFATAGLILLYEKSLHHFLTYSDTVHTDDVTFPRDISPQTLMPQPDNLEAKPFIRHRFLGRLGNVFFQYASIYCIAKQMGARPVLPNLQYLNYLRDPGVLFSREQLIAFKSDKFIAEKYCCSFDKRLMSLPPNKNYSIGGYLQSWRYFEPCKEDIRRIFTFKEKFVKDAESVLTALRRKFPGRSLVGIHIRMEDHTNIIAMTAGKRTATGEYFLKAMAYFRNRYGDVIFVVFTSSDEWWKRHVRVTDNVTFVARSHPATDMEVLSRLDHLIISVGTFGWWAAYRSTGTVVLYSDFYTPGSRFGRQFLHNDTDYVYPGWIRM